MTSQPPPKRLGRIRLGNADRALLRRLRTIALLFRAGEPALPALRDIEICLQLGPEGRVEPLHLVGRVAGLLLVEAAGWQDLLVEFSDGPHIHSNIFFPRLAEAEIPTEEHLDLWRLLRRMVANKPVAPATLDLLARAGWTVHPTSPIIVPALPAALTLSAHETVEILFLAEAGGGFGPGPLGCLAREVAARMMPKRSPED